ncbi:type II toxin-antitoxin system RelB/DinJ family antitoxin [Actinotignum sp. GS-2025d]|uniref:type II toxin-antitoxin system RelB/DinJ family antitoxin n=1 Tax=Actinotignum sp. GS-2025d TaxID=3427277 RepID=UPI003F448017
MAYTPTITIRIDPELKFEAESVFRGFGLSMTEAIRIFLHKAVMVGGFPFPVRALKFQATTEKIMITNESEYYDPNDILDDDEFPWEYFESRQINGAAQ